MPNLNGIDISNHNRYIDWNNLDPRVKYVYIKATEGTTYQDPSLEEHYSNASRNHNVGFYHFLRSTSAPETQAENFYNQIKDKRNDLKPVLDIEEAFGSLMDYILRFINRFNQLTGGSMPLIMYTYVSFANENLDSRLAGYPMWIAHYGVSSPAPTNVWGNNYIGFQFSGDTDSIQGVQGACDLDDFTDGILMGAPYQGGGSTPTPQPSTVIPGKILDLQRLCNSINGAGILEDGIWGDQTDGAVQNLPLCGKDYHQPELTTWVQLRLGCNPDGVFWNETDGAVRGWQSEHGLTVDGVVGYHTYKSLARA
jgi:GH25 family lysozyme M1 (1,4-beta-N-acetylmuramidase)